MQGCVWLVAVGGGRGVDEALDGECVDPHGREDTTDLGKDVFDGGLDEAF